MENKISIRGLRRPLDQVVLHEQLENGIAINNNLSAYQVDQWFETSRKVFKIKQKHPWTEERLVGHRTPQVTPIIPREMQIGEAQRCTNSLQQNSRRVDCKIKNANSQVKFTRRSWGSEP